MARYSRSKPAIAVPHVRTPLEASNNGRRLHRQFSLPTALQRHSLCADRCDAEGNDGPSRAQLSGGRDALQTRWYTRRRAGTSCCAVALPRSTAAPTACMINPFLKGTVMHADSINKALKARLHTASQISQGLTKTLPDKGSRSFLPVASHMCL